MLFLHLANKTLVLFITGKYNTSISILTNKQKFHKPDFCLRNTTSRHDRKGNTSFQWRDILYWQFLAVAITHSFFVS